jgi:general secretion pathway protein H
MPKTSAIGSAGFTLLELLVVLAILVLVSAAWPLMFSHRALQARRDAAGVQRLVSGLREVQSYSIQRGMPVRVRLQDRILHLDVALVSSVLSARPLEDIPIDAPVSQLPEGGSDSQWVTFFPDGSSSGAQYRVGEGSAATTVWISPATGRIRVKAPST